MNKFSKKLKKPCFRSIFPIFGAKNISLENRALTRSTSYGFLASCQNLEKVNDTIQTKCQTDRRTEGQWKDGQTLFYRTLPATAREPIINIFIIEQTQWKLMTKFFFKFKKTIFAAFPQFSGQKGFSKKSGCHGQLYKGF